MKIAYKIIWIGIVRYKLSLKMRILLQDIISPLINLALKLFFIVVSIDPVNNDNMQLTRHKISCIKQQKHHRLLAKIYVDAIYSAKNQYWTYILQK